MENKNTRWRVSCFCNTVYAAARWQTRWYKLKSSAIRRLKQIRNADDHGVDLILLIDTDIQTEFRKPV